MPQVPVTRECRVPPEGDRGPGVHCLIWSVCLRLAPEYDSRTVTGGRPLLTQWRLDGHAEGPPTVRCGSGREIADLRADICLTLH